MSSYSSNAGTIALIEQTATAAGAGWPGTLADALAAADAVKHAAPTAPDPAEAAEAAYAALAAGDDPADDPDVRRALARHHLAALVPRGALEGLASRARLEALTGHADTLYAALKQAVAEADQTIHDARDQIGPSLDVFDQEQAAGLARPGQSAAWARARDAAARIEQAVQCWKLIANLTRGPEIGNNYAALHVADLNADELEDVMHQAQQVKITYRDVIRAGHRLDLATPDEYRARCEAVRQQRDAQAERDSHGFRDAFRRSHGGLTA